MSSSPVNFDVNFAGLDGAISQWRSYQTSLESIINVSNQLATAQQSLQQVISQMGSGFQGASTGVDSYSASLQVATQQQTQFQTAAQQQISILSGAGTEAGNAATQYTSFNDALGNVAQEVDAANGGLNEHNTLMGNLAGTAETASQKIQGLGGAFGMAAGSITGLIFSAHSLNRAYVMMHRSEVMLESATNTLADRQAKLGDAVLKYGADSAEVASIEADIAIQRDKIGVMNERVSLTQESYNMQLVAFATTTGPLVISTFSSLSQAITSMGQILKISRVDVMNFISAWGPWMAAGAAAALVITDLISVMTQLNQLEQQRQTAIASGDSFAKLNAELKELQTINADPLFKIGEAISNIFGGQLGQEAMKEFHAELDLRQWQSDITSQIDAFVTSPDFKNLWNQIPEQLRGGLAAKIDEIVGIPFNPTNYLDVTGQHVDPKVMEKSKELLTNEFIPKLREMAQKTVETMNRITISGSPEERAQMMGLPTAKDWTQATAYYKGQLENIFLVLKDFNNKRLQDFTLTWDRYIANTKVPEGLANLAKSFVNLQSSFVMGTEAMNPALQGLRTGVQGMTQEGLAMAGAFQGMQGGLQDTTAALDELLPKSKDVVAIMNQLGQTASMTGTDLANSTSRYDEIKNKVEELTAGHKEQIAVEQGVHQAMVQQVQLWAGPLPQGIEFTTEQLVAANDEFTRTGDKTKAMSVLMAENKAQADALAKSLGDVAQMTEDMATATDFATRTHDAANAAIATWFTELNEGIAIEDAQRQSLIEMAQGFGIDLPAGIELTAKQLMALIEAYKQTGTAEGALAAIHNKVFSDMHKQVDELVSAAIEGGKDWTEAWKGIKEGIPKGEGGFFKDFFKDLGQFQEAETVLNSTATALDAFLDITGGQMDSQMIDDFSNKFVKDIKELRRQADDLPYVGDQLDGLLAAAQQFADQADSAEDFRVLNSFIEDLNSKMEGGLSASEIEELQKKWGALFDAWNKGANVDFNALQTGIEGLATATDSMVRSFDKIQTNDAGNISWPTTNPFDVQKDGDTGKTPPAVDVTANATTTDFSTLTDEQKTLDIIGNVASLTLGLTGVTDVSFSGTLGSSVGSNAGPGIGGAIGGMIGELIMKALGMDPAKPMFELPKFGILMQPPDLLETVSFGDGEDNGKNKDLQTVIPAAITEAFDQSIYDATSLVQIFQTMVNTLELILPAPNIDAFAEVMNTLLLIPADFMTRWNEAFVGDEEGGGGLLIPVPNAEEFINLMNTLLLIPEDFMSRWNEAFSGDEEGGGGLTIPPPNVEEFMNVMNTLLLIPEDFINRWNDAFGGGGGGNDEEDGGGGGGGGFVIPAPDIALFADALNLGLELTDQFITTFTDAMDASVEAADSASGDIVTSFEDIQTQAEDATAAVEDLQSAIDNLEDKTITITVDITGPGVQYLAKGFHGVVNKPTLMVVGEAGPERVDVSNTNAEPTGLLMDRHINIVPEITTSNKARLMGNDNQISDLISGVAGGISNMPNRDIIAQQVLRYITIPIKVNIGQRTIIDIIKEHLLDE